MTGSGGCLLIAGASVVGARAAGRAGRPDGGGVTVNAFQGPVGIAAVAGRHMVRHRGRSAPARGTDVGGNPLAASEYLDGAGGEPNFNLLAEQGVRHAVEVLLDLNVVVNATRHRFHSA